METKTPFRENWLIFWGIWGEAKLILRIWGAKEKYFQGADDSGIKGAQTSLGSFQKDGPVIFNFLTG